MRDSLRPSCPAKAGAVAVFLAAIDITQTFPTVNLTTQRIGGTPRKTSAPQARRVRDSLRPARLSDYSNHLRELRLALISGFPGLTVAMPGEVGIFTDLYDNIRYSRWVLLLFSSSADSSGILSLDYKITITGTTATATTTPTTFKTGFPPKPLPLTTALPPCS